MRCDAFFSARVHTRDTKRGMFGPLLYCGQDFHDVSLADMTILDDQEGAESPVPSAMSPPVDYQAKAQAAKQFGISRAERAWR